MKQRKIKTIESELFNLYCEGFKKAHDIGNFKSMKKLAELMIDSMSINLEAPIFSWGTIIQFSKDFKEQLLKEYSMELIIKCFPDKFHLIFNEVTNKVQILGKDWFSDFSMELELNEDINKSIYMFLEQNKKIINMDIARYLMYRIDDAHETSNYKSYNFLFEELNKTLNIKTFNDEKLNHYTKEKYQLHISTELKSNYSKEDILNIFSDSFEVCFNAARKQIEFEGIGWIKGLNYTIKLKDENNFMTFCINEQSSLGSIFYSERVA